MKLEPRYRPRLALGFIYDGKGMYQQAVNEFQASLVDGETTGGQCYLGYALALAGRREEAKAIVAKLNSTKKYVSPVELAVLYATLGDKERALALLEKGYAAHDLQLQNLIVDWHLDGLRSEPRFQDLVRRVGLPQ